MFKEELILIGGGGHCKAVIDVIESQETYIIAGIIDIKEKVGEIISGYKVIATDNDIEYLSKIYKQYFITVGQIKSNTVRVALFNKLKNLGVEMPVIISPKAHVSTKSSIGEGSIIMHHAIVNAAARIGNNCIINTASIIEHDVFIGDHSHVSTGAVINGDAIIEEHCFIGSNAVVNQSIKIGKNGVIGSGAVVIHHTNEHALYVGNPAELKK